MKRNKKLYRPLLLLACLVIHMQALACCQKDGGKKAAANQELIEFKRGDILVKANHNWLPGTSFAEGGSGFGHAAIVLKGGEDTSVIDLLERTILFESHARDVAPQNQIRIIEAVKFSQSKDSLNTSFSEKYACGRYRLRLDLDETQIEAILKAILEQDSEVSSWRALKQYKTQKNYHDNDNWYCTLLIWQAFYNVLGIDLDANKGLVVYPNDIIGSPLFSKPGAKLQF